MIDIKLFATFPTLNVVLERIHFISSLHFTPVILPN